MDLISLSVSQIYLRLFLALLIGFILGLERSIAGKSAGPRTFGLVCMGSCLFTILTHVISREYLGVIQDFDPLRVISSIIVGVGFLGAGTIFIKRNNTQKERVSGLTTAAGLWAITGIGITIGIGKFKLAIFSGLLIFAVFTLFWFIETKIIKLFPDAYKAGEGKKNNEK